MDDPRWHDHAPAPPAVRLRDLGPGEDDPVSTHTCRVCRRVFARRHWLAMHMGADHAAVLAPDEAAAWGRAEAREDAYLARLRKHVRASLVVVPGVLFYFYAVILLDNAGGNPALGIIPLPGLVGFLALIYYMVFTRDEAPVRGKSS